MTYPEYVAATMRACEANGVRGYVEYFKLDDISDAIEITTYQNYEACKTPTENADIIRDNILSILHRLWADMPES